MKQFLSFVRKEFYHVFRDNKTLLMLFGLPIVLIVLFGFAITNEIKNAKIIVCDYAKDPASQEIINKLSVNNTFHLEKALLNHSQIEEAFKKENIKLAIIFPANFNKDLLHLNKAQVQIISRFRPKHGNYAYQQYNGCDNGLSKRVDTKQQYTLQHSTRNKNVVQSRTKRSDQFCARHYGIGVAFGLCADDCRFYRKRKRNRHNGNSIGFAFQSAFGYHFKSTSFFAFIACQSCGNPYTKRYLVGYAHKRQCMAIDCRKYIAYYLCLVVGFAYFKQYKITTNGNAFGNDGNDVAYNAVHRLYVSLREYACRITSNSKYFSVKMVLHHCKINNDKRFGIFRYLERNANPFRYYNPVIGFKS